jgi:hypothetical protein
VYNRVEKVGGRVARKFWWGSTVNQWWSGIPNQP